MFEHLLHTNMGYFCLYLCYIRKCNMAEPMLHTKIWYLSVSALFFLHMKMCNVLFSFTFFSEFGQMHIKMFQTLEGSDSLVFKIWISAEPLLMINGIWQSLCLAHVNSNVYASFYHNIQKVSRYRASFTVFQNLNLGNASANPKWHLTISWATSCQYQYVCKVSSQ